MCYQLIFYSTSALCRPHPPAALRLLPACPFPFVPLYSIAMLHYLRIRNLALIADAELEFATGFNALTGETGAGKSFILKALDFVSGGRMDAGHVRPGADKAVVEAIFEVDGAEA